MNNNKALIRRAPLRVALTGGLASGKSYALEFFKKLGFATISSDEIVNKLYLKREVVEEIRKILPNCIVDDKVDKKKIENFVGRTIEIYVVNDEKKFDPENMSRKALPGQPGVYLE